MTQSETPGLASTGPRARNRDEGLISRHVSDEKVLYDVERSKALCLSPMAVRVWDLCDGRHTPDQMATTLQTSTGLEEEVSRGVVDYALARFRRHQLLSDRPSMSNDRTLTRRELLARLRTIGMAAILPTVVALAAPQPADAQSMPVVCGQGCHISQGIFCPIGCFCSKPSGNGVCLTA